MIGRRDLLIGVGCVGAGAAAYAFVPRRRVSLLGARKIDAIVPRAFGDWTSTDTTDLVAPTEPGGLAARLYGETIGRVYRQVSTGAQIMVLAAHGDTQSDDLQLHRPEICYPAFGFAITSSRPVDTPLAPGVSLPSRALVASVTDRQEVVLYWTRLGEYLPQSRREQQVDRLRTALHGEIGDGVLMRLSVDSPDAAGAVLLMQGFTASLVRAMAPGDRSALIGTERASKLV